MDTFEKIIEHLDRIQDRTKLMSLINDIIYMHVSEDDQNAILVELERNGYVLPPIKAPKWPEGPRIRDEADVS